MNTGLNPGMMEHWNVGILERWNIGFGGMRSVLYGWHGSENKIRSSSAFYAQYSIFLSDPEALRAGGRHSIIPWII
jgi:hypothetical protein